MEEYTLPPAVKRLIAETLESMDHVEVLFRISRGSGLTADALATDAQIKPAQVDKVLRDLEHAKLIVNDAGTYRVSDDPRQRAAVDEFAAAYNARPVTLIRAIYARPSPLRSFADAFRLRRED